MSIELIKDTHPAKGQIKAAIFDFDGTVSTLRCGWESVMHPLMVEMIGAGKRDDAELHKLVDDYIDASTGIQTVYQMKWLAEQVAAFGLAEEVHDEWWYKDEYNRRLMQQVSTRIEKLRCGEISPSEYIISGSVEFLTALKARGIDVYVASGTDHDDVVNEIGVLGLSDCFTYIKGAPARQAACSKEAVIKMIIEEKNLRGDELVLVGDGKVEIALGIENGAYALGIASDEEVRSGVNPVKRSRLLTAGACAIVGDFEAKDELLTLLGI